MGANVYDVINQRILELLQKGTVPWRKPWRAAGGGQPMNLISMKPYKGINVWLTACQEYGSPYWLTFKQCQDKGGHIIKGSKSTPVIFFQWLGKKDAEPTSGDTSTKGKIPLLRYYSVFNIEQTSLTPPETEEIHSDFEPITIAENIITNMPMRPEIKYGGDRAYYSPSLDYIQLPHQHTFDTIEHFQNTRFHELAHATGHANRLGRKSILEPSYFGSHEYSGQADLTGQ